MTTRYKFSDRDVRERPELVAEAIRYLRWYEGDAEFLIDVKRYEQANGSLPIPTARAVLNWMRQDARYAMVADIPEPAWYDTAPPPPAIPRPRHLQPVRDVDEDEDDEPKYKYPYNVKVTWKKLYGISPGVGSVSTARVWHHLDTAGSEIRYYPAVREFKPHIRWLCGHRSTHLLLDAPPITMDECKGCRRIRCERGLTEQPDPEPIDLADLEPTDADLAEVVVPDIDLTPPFSE